MDLEKMLQEAQDFLKKVQDEKTRLNELEHQVIGRIQTYHDIQKLQEAEVSEEEVAEEEIVAEAVSN
jgi:two-component sensor histidine kinase